MVDQGSLRGEGGPLGGFPDVEGLVRPGEPWSNLGDFEVRPRLINLSTMEGTINNIIKY